MSFSKLNFVTGDVVNLPYQLVSKDTGFPINITGNTFRFAAKLKPSESTYIIDPVDGTIDDAAAGKFSFDITLPDDPDDGVYEVEMLVAGVDPLTLTPGGGVAITISQEIIPNP